jgi:hypothetical protein
MEARHRTPARLLALIALVGAAVALALIISNASGGNGTSASSSERSAEKARDLGKPAGDRARRHGGKRNADKLPEDVYVVKSGDTLGGIAETTGVPVERLQELNPGLDQFQLVAGQRIKLR